MHHPTDRIAYSTAFVTTVVEHWLEREITIDSNVKVTGIDLRLTYHQRRTVQLRQAASVLSNGEYRYITILKK